MLTLDKASKAGHIPRILNKEVHVQFKIGRNYHLFNEITGECFESVYGVTLPVRQLFSEL